MVPDAWLIIFKSIVVCACSVFLVPELAPSYVKVHNDCFAVEQTPTPRRRKCAGGEISRGACNAHLQNSETEYIIPPLGRYLFDTKSLALSRQTVFTCKCRGCTSAPACTSLPVPPYLLLKSGLPQLVKAPANNRSIIFCRTLQRNMAASSCEEGGAQKAYRGGVVVPLDTVLLL